MKTYLKVLFNSEGGKPSKITAALQGLGFKPTTGAHDYVYDWPGSASVEEVLAFGDLIHQDLAGLGCMFEMETI